MKALVVSIKDAAGMNLFQRFVERGFREGKSSFQGMPVFEKGEFSLVRVEQDIIHAQGIDSLGASELIFASRHKSESGKPTLTAHATGNFGKAEYGGNEREFSFVNANTMRNIFLEMLDSPPDGYAVSLEQTHHGPTGFVTPMCFVELGSSEAQWKDEKAAGFIADCIISGLGSKNRAEAACGFGGNHYSQLFTSLEKEYAFGHMCPKYSLPFLDENLAMQMARKSGAHRAVIDKKGINVKARLLTLLKDCFEEIDFR